MLSQLDCIDGVIPFTFQTHHIISGPRDKQADYTLMKPAHTHAKP